MLQKPTVIPEQKAPVIVRTLLKIDYLQKGANSTKTETQRGRDSAIRTPIPNYKQLADDP